MPGGRYNVKPLQDRLYPEYKYREMLAAIGSDLDVQNLIASYGFDRPSLDVIRGWRTRNSIPSRWLPLLMHKVMSSGLLTKPDALIKSPFG